MKIHTFSTNGDSTVKNLNTCVLNFSIVSVVWSVGVCGSLYGF